MIIYFDDGSHAVCDKVEIIGDRIYWDECRYADANSVVTIESCEEGGYTDD